LGYSTFHFPALIYIPLPIAVYVTSASIFVSQAIAVQVSDHPLADAGVIAVTLITWNLLWSWHFAKAMSAGVTVLTASASSWSFHENRREEEEYVEAGWRPESL
jgi:hypothetical protein